MKATKLPYYRSKIEKIRSDLVGEVERNMKSRKEESVEPVADISDEAAQAYSRQMMLALGEQEWQKLQLVDEALKKIDGGKYGFCTECEKSIPEARLDVVPFTKYCVNCLDNIEKGNGLNDH